MRILVTGCYGYIGTVLVPRLQAVGHEVVGVDNGYFKGCVFGPLPPDIPCIGDDVRDLQQADLAGIDAIVHLAALSNDPLGNLDREVTLDINYRASVRLAQLAKAAGASKFIFSSSCSSYGASGDDLLDEDAVLAPVTAYAESKVETEKGLAGLSDDRFCVTSLRNATAYGFSPRLRLDLVLNDFVASAVATGVILIKSDGTPWRPVVHVEDICHAIEVVLQAPAKQVRERAFNIGQTAENYRISQLAEMVCEVVPGSRIHYEPGGGPDKRCYRVSCQRVTQELPQFQPQWTVPKGIQQLYEVFKKSNITKEDIEGSKYFRLRTLQPLLQSGKLDSALRWQHGCSPIACS